MVLTPDQIKNLPPGENVSSVLFRKNLTANKNAGQPPKVGYQGSTELPSVTLTRKKLGKSIPKVEGEEPINTPRIKNYVEKPPWQKLGIYEANDIYSTLKDMYRQYDLGKVVHPGLAMGALFSPALTASAIPFLFQGENFRKKLKELSEKYQLETIKDFTIDILTGAPQRKVAGSIVGGIFRGVSSMQETRQREQASSSYMDYKAFSNSLSDEEKKATGFPDRPWRVGDDESAWKTRANAYFGKQKYGKPYSPFVAGQGGGEEEPLSAVTSRPQYTQARESIEGMSVKEYADEYISSLISDIKGQKQKVTAKPGTQQNVMQTFGTKWEYSKDPIANIVMQISQDPLIWAIPISAASRKGIITAAKAGKIALSKEALVSLEKSGSFSEFFFRTGMREGFGKAGEAVRTVLDTPVFRKLADEGGYIRFPWKAKGGDVSNIEVFTREVLRRPRETLKQLGKGGDKLERMMVRTLLEGEEAGGRAITRTRALFEKLPEKDWSHFVDVMEGKVNPKNELVAELANKVGLYRDYIAKIAPKMDFKIYNPKTGKLKSWTPVKDYFPRDLNWNLIKKDRDVLADYLLKTKQVKDIDEAKKILSRQRWGEATAGHLEVARTFKLPDKYYVKSPQLTWERYVEEINKRLYERKVFGRKYKNAFAAIEDIRKEIGGEDAKWAHDIFMEHVKGAITNKKDFTTPLRNYHIATKMTFSAIQNSTQKFINESLDGNIRGILKATRQYRTTVGKEKALQTGAILRSVLEDQMKRIGLHTDSLSGQVASEALKIQKFSAAETYNRIFTALKSFDQLDWAFKKLVKNPKSKKYRSMFEPLVRYFAFDLDKAIKTGKLPNAKLQRMYANYQVIRKHFRGGSLFKPPGWNTRGGKLLTQFKTFIYDEGALVKDAIKTGIKNNNYTPLIAFLTVFPAIGQIPAEFFAKVRGRERRWTGKDRVPGWPGDIPAPLARYIEGISYVGGFGLAYEVLQSAEFGEKGIAGLLGGPTTSDVLEVGKGAYQAAVEKKPADLAKWLVRQIPGVGTTLKRKLYSEKGQPKWISLGTRRILERQRERGEESARTVNSFIEAVESGDKTAIKKAAESFKGTNYPINLKSIQGAWSAKEQMGKKFWKLPDEEKAKRFEAQIRGIDKGESSIPMVANKAVQEYLKTQPGGEKLLTDLVAFKVGSIRDRNKSKEVKQVNRGRVRTAIAGFISKNKSKSWQQFLQMYGGLVVPLKGKGFGSKEGKPRYEAFKKAIDELKQKDEQFAREFMLIPNVFSSDW